MILMIDNYDSFTYNLVQYLQELKEDVRVVENDEITIDEIIAWNPEAIVISPGPCTPKEAGISLAVVQQLAGVYPILGICLGHQTIGAAFGMEVVKLKEPVHGKIHSIRHRGTGCFQGLPETFSVTRYHSLTLDPQTLPEELEITCETMDHVIMGIQHKTYPLEGIQFHPEAVLTEYGKELLAGFLKKADRWNHR